MRLTREPSARNKAKVCDRMAAASHAYVRGCCAVALKRHGNDCDEGRIDHPQDGVRDALRICIWQFRAGYPFPT